MLRGLWRRLIMHAKHKSLRKYHYSGSMAPSLALVHKAWEQGEQMLPSPQQWYRLQALYKKQKRVATATVVTVGLSSEVTGTFAWWTSAQEHKHPMEPVSCQHSKTTETRWHMLLPGGLSPRLRTASSQLSYCDYQLCRVSCFVW